MNKKENIKNVVIGIVLILGIISAVTLANAITYSDCSIYGNCPQPIFKITSVNYSLVDTNDSQFLRGYTPTNLPVCYYQFGTNNFNGSGNFTTTGKIGINIAKPVGMLDVNNSNPSTYGIIVRNIAGGAIGGTETFLAQNMNGSGQATFIFKVNATGYTSYGGVLYGGSSQTTGGLFGASNRKDKLYFFADGSQNQGLYIGTLVNTPVVFGSNNLERFRIDTKGNLNVSNNMTIAGNYLNVTKNLFVNENITLKHGGRIWDNETCTFISSPDGSTIQEVCNV